MVPRRFDVHVFHCLKMNTGVKLVHTYLMGDNGCRINSLVVFVSRSHSDFH